MSHSLPWQDTLAELRRSLPTPDAAVNGLLKGYHEDAVVEAGQLSDRMLLPRQSTPRVSPASLRVLRVAHDFGCFFHTYSLRVDLVPPAQQDDRWQSGFLQHNMIASAAAGAGANFEVHDLAHAVLGLMWWPDIGLPDFYLASRLSEATAAYHYYFLDQALEPRCAAHENIVDLARIWKFNVCQECNRPENRYYNLSEPRKRRAQFVAEECVRQANAFYLTELDEIAEETTGGVRFVERNRWNHAANSADALRYAHHTQPFLKHEKMRPYLDLLRDWQIHRSFGAYLGRCREVLPFLSGMEEPAERPAAEVASRRQSAVAQDLMLRLCTVLVQMDFGLRSLPAPSVEAIAECVQRLAAWAGGKDELADVFTVLNSHRGAPAEVATVGYEPMFAWTVSSGVDTVTHLADEPDLALFGAAMEAGLRSALPRTMRYLADAGALSGVLSRFRTAFERFATVVQPVADGRAPRTDQLVQRFQQLLERMSVPEDPSYDAARTALAVSTVEHEYTRYQVRVRGDLDIRPPAVDEHVPAPTLLRLGPATEVVASDVDIARPVGLSGVDRPVSGTYVFSLTRGRTYLTRSTTEVGRLLGRLRSRSATAADICSSLQRLGADPDTAWQQVRAWLRIGVLVPRAGGFADVASDDMAQAMG